MENVAAYAHRLFVDHWLVKSILAAFFVFVEYIFVDDLNAKAAVVAMVVITLDTLTGVRAAAKTGHPIRSSKFAAWCTKMVVYLTILFLVAANTEHLDMLKHLHKPFTGGVLCFIILTESISILENLSRAGDNVPPFLINYLKGNKEKLNQYLESISNSDKHDRSHLKEKNNGENPSGNSGPNR